MASDRNPQTGMPPPFSMPVSAPVMAPVAGMMPIPDTRMIRPMPMGNFPSLHGILPMPPRPNGILSLPIHRGMTPMLAPGKCLSFFWVCTILLFCPLFFIVIFILLGCHFVFVCFVFSCIFTLLSRKSDQCAIRACFGVAGHLSTAPRWGNPLNVFPNDTTSKLAGLFLTLSL